METERVSGWMADGGRPMGARNGAGTLGGLMGSAWTTNGPRSEEGLRGQEANREDPGVKERGRGWQGVSVSTLILAEKDGRANMQTLSLRAL